MSAFTRGANAFEKRFEIITIGERPDPRGGAGLIGLNLLVSGVCAQRRAPRSLSFGRVSFRQNGTRGKHRDIGSRGVDQCRPARGLEILPSAADGKSSVSGVLQRIGKRVVSIVKTMVPGKR